MSNITITDALNCFKKQHQMTSKQNSTQPIDDSINKCLVVFFLTKVNANEVATNSYMDKLLGVSTDSVKAVRSFKTSDPTITTAFVEMTNASLISHVIDQWNNEKSPNIALYSANEFLRNVASRKFKAPFNTASSAFHALYKPNTVASLLMQQPQQVNVQVHPSTAPVQALPNNNPFRLPQTSSAPIQSSSVAAAGTSSSNNHHPHRPPPLSDVYASGGHAAAVAAPSYPLSAPIQIPGVSYSSAAAASHIVPMPPQTYGGYSNPSTPIFSNPSTPMFDPLLQQPQQQINSAPYYMPSQQQQMDPQTFQSAFNFNFGPPNTSYNNGSNSYSNNSYPHNGYY